MRAAREAERLAGVEARAAAFRSDRDKEADEAKQKQAECEAAEARRAREGDISSAPARYAIALGETYAVRDPYASLARAAMVEYAMMIRAQEQMRAEIAAESDPAKRQVIALRMQIESCDYMTLTSDRLSGISLAITGQAESEQAVTDRTRAQAYCDQAAALRTERSVLIETIQDRVQVSTVEPGRSTRSQAAAAQTGEPNPAREPIATPISGSSEAVVAPATASSFKAQPAEPEASGAAAEPPPATEQPAGLTAIAVTDSPSHEPAQAGTANPGLSPSSASPVPEPANDPGEPVPVFIARGLRRDDTIEAPALPHVTMEQGSEVPLSTSAEAPWLNVLRQRFGSEPEEEAGAGEEVSDNAVARLAKRLEKGKTQDRSEKGKDEPDPGSEPDL